MRAAPAADHGRAAATPGDGAHAGVANRHGFRPKRLPRLVGGLAAGGLVLFAGFVVLSTLAFTILSHIPVPQGDEWDSLDLFDRMARGGGSWLDLFEPHNEHRLFFPRLVFFSDYLFFGGRGLLEQAAIFAVQFLHVALFAWLVRRSGAGPAARWGLAAVAAVLLFSLAQSENFGWAFQVQFVGVFACASLCCAVFALALDADRAGRPAAGPLAAAGLLALVDAYTMANGLLAGFALAFMACLARARPLLVAATVGAAVALVLLFSLGYRLDDGHPGAAALLRDLPAELAFTAGYLGNVAPFGPAGKVAFGAVGLLAALALTARGALTRDVGPARLALLGIASFAAGSAALTALGRARLGLGGFEASRYATGAATFWAAVLIEGWACARGAAVRSAVRAAVSVAAAVLLAACGASQMQSGRGMERRAAAYGAVGDAMILDLVDAPALAALDERVDMVRQESPLLRRRRLSVFGTRDADRIGRPLFDAGASPIPCFGTFASARAAPSLGRDGAVVSGFSGLRSRFGRPGRVYVVDAARRVVGLARTGPGDGAWSGYARVPPGARVSAYAMSDAGRVCSLGSAAVSAVPPG